MRGRGGGYIAQHSGIEGVWLAWGLGGTPPHGRERSGLILRSRPEAEPLRKRVGRLLRLLKPATIRSCPGAVTGYGLACGGVLARNQLGVAHNTAPCGTLIAFSYAGRSVTVPVIDRGP